MRPPRARYTIRSLMIAVAGVVTAALSSFNQISVSRPGTGRP